MKSFTVDDLDRMPDDGRRYELLDGALIVSPRPRTSHQEAAAELLVLLRAACPAHLRVIAEPAVQLSKTTEFDPDLVVIRQEQLGCGQGHGAAAADCRGALPEHSAH
jgi:Uma2 family endonuclease